jgi:hypothetical protein
MMRCEPFWLERPTILFRDFKFLPKTDMTLEEQMNCMTRLVFFVFLFLYIVNYQQSVLFMILSIIFIIILYYLQKSRMTTIESYQPSQRVSTIERERERDRFSQPALQPTRQSTPQPQPQPQRQPNYIEQKEALYQQGVQEHQNNRYSYNKFPSYFTQQIDPLIPVHPDTRFVSANQNMVGGANPKTRAAPIVPPPMYDWTHWKENDFVVPSVINERRSQDLYGSGYYTSDGGTQRRMKGNGSSGMGDDKPAYKIYQTIPQNDPVLNNASLLNPTLNTMNINNKNKTNKQTVEHFTYISEPADKKDCKSCQMPGGPPPPPGQQLKKTNGDFKQFEAKTGDDKKIRYSGDVIESPGYDETNLFYHLPTNYPSTNCQRNQAVSGVNDEIFTSIISPGVIYKNQIIEPIASNIGVSFEQQIPPRKMVNENGQVVYTAMDPKLYTPIDEPEEPLDVAANYDIYDPRSNGYGTSYRGYTDKMTGQPRFYYDDIDSVRRPNYIARTNIDHIKGMDTYGPIRDDDDTRMNNEMVREIAENDFKDQTIDFRTDMMTRLMRKRNAELWQLRMAPKSGMQKSSGMTLNTFNCTQSAKKCF